MLRRTHCNYGSLATLLSRADQTIDTELIAEQWDRMGLTQRVCVGNS